MPFTIVRDDMARVRADALVNTANPLPVIGAGVDAALHRAAGPELLAARQAIGEIAPGQAAVTPAFGLRAMYVIHTVAPFWQGGTMGETDTLAGCYRASLELARRNGCASIAFPLLATGNNGFPRALALQIAADVFTDFLARHEMQITLVVYNREAFVLSRQLADSVQSYIDETYVQEHEDAVYGAPRAMLRCTSAAPAPPREQPLEVLLEQMDAGFSETLLKLIDHTGKTDAEIYKKANVDRKLFSKIRKDPGYRPSKPTAVAFCMALELSLDAAEDLMGRAGYALSHSSKFDIIVEYFLLHGNYDLFQLNETLFHYDQPLVGGM